jgi:signal transduction histidine kinase
MKFSLSSRLLAVALLGVFSCAVAFYGLAHILQLTMASRYERARDAVATELLLLKRSAPPDASASSPVPPAVRVAMLGMRGGYVRSETAFDTEPTPVEMDEPVRQKLAQALHAASGTSDVVVRDTAGQQTILVVGATAVAPGVYGWITYSIPPPLFIATWRFIMASLGVATLLLVITAVSTVVLVRKGAAALNASLSALASDLAAPVPRPPVPELADLGDHIEGLAGALARAQKDKERLGSELAQRDRLSALGRVVAGVAHEVRNPLASIKLRVDLGRMRADTPEQLARELASVSEEVTRLDRLVADLLVVAGRRQGSRATASLGELVERRACLLAPWATERGIHLEVTGAATCNLDTDAVARAVDNLVRNAVEASPEGAAVEIEVREDERAVRVRVLDRGTGVDGGRVQELFEPFFTTKPEGTGLGLALSRAVATAHGGSLTYGRQGGVTCFELSFPRGTRGVEPSTTVPADPPPKPASSSDAQPEVQA